MRWFRDRKTVTKLMIGFACVGLITVLVGWMGLRSMAAINGNTQDLYEAQLLPFADLTVLRAGNL